MFELMKGYLLVFFLILGSFAGAQDHKRTQNWYFGDKAGLSFATNPPTALTDGQMGAIEGCATISDVNGNLLFYTNGNSVWNRNHQVMPNGTGLLGHGSSTQAALIVPQPGNDSLYYVFTTVQTGQPNGFRYSIVNMNRDNGMGDITTKNILLETPVCEKLTATRHANGKDIWVLTHGFGNDLFYAYLVTKDGIVNCPITSKIGSIHTTSNITNAIGTMNFSPSGRRLAVCQYDLYRVELFDFDASKGTLSNFTYAAGVVLPYSAMFSPNEKLLYVTNRLNYFYQYNISAFQHDSITNSRVSLYSPPNTLHSYYTYVQLAPNQKLYVALVDSTFIGCIHFPDTGGTACDFEQKAIDISPKVSKYGLPNFVTSYFHKPSVDFEYELDCESNTSILKAKDTIGATAYQWRITNTGTQIFTGNPLIHQFSDTGEYTVELHAINGNDTAKQSKKIMIYPAYSLNLGNDTLLCFGQTLELDAGLGQHCYLWNDSSTASTLQVTDSGIYSVKVVSKGFCTYYDTIQVDFIQPPADPIIINRTGDTLLASGNFHSYQWFRNNVQVQGSSINRLTLTENGTYKVTGTDSLNCFPIISADFVVDTLTSTGKIVKQGLIVFPNPVIEGAELHVLSDIRIKSIELYGIEGKKVFEEKLLQPVYEYHIDRLFRGMYILNINNLSNYKIIVK